MNGSTKQIKYGWGANMGLIRIAEEDNWAVDYDRIRGMYRVSYFENGHFVAECWFACYGEREFI